MLRNIPFQKLYCLVPVLGALIRREAMLISLCMEEIFDGFYWDVKEKIHSLLMFDIVEADESISDELKQEIEKDGVTIYEKNR